MFSISKNDVSEFLKKEKNTNEFYGSFFSFFPRPIIHLVIPSESRELGATRDPALHRTSFSLLLSTLPPYCLPLPALQRPSFSLCCSLCPPSSPYASALSCSILLLNTEP